MIDQYWKGFERIADTDARTGEAIKSTLYELNGGEIKPLYKLYYIFKPIIPRALQIYLRRLTANFILRGGYESMDDLYCRVLIDFLKANGKPFHFIWFWPNRMEMASLVTHDIETLSGFRSVLQLADIDDRYHIKSSFKFVPEGYTIDHGIINELKSRNFEIAIHGLNHDGRLFVSSKVFREKMLKIENYAQQWKTFGFRSPSLLRNYNLMKNFKFNWDSSFPDWDPYGPQPGGCRTVFPYFISKHTVELPVTIMQDHTLFEILNRKNISIWYNKFQYIKSLHGLANIIVHPDYIFKAKRIKYYHEYLEFLCNESRVWQTYPNEVSEWWRCRDRASIEKNRDGSLHIKGNGMGNATIATANVDPDSEKLHYVQNEKARILI